MGSKKDTVIVSVRLKADVKEDMQEVCEELGITMAGAFQMFASAVARGRCIPLDLSLDTRPSSIRYESVGLPDKNVG